jgi:hypothetical protein
MFCEKCGESLQADVKICEKCGASTSGPPVKIYPSSPRLSLGKRLLVGLAVIVGGLYIAAAIYYISGAVGEKLVSNTKSSIPGNIPQPKVDIPQTTKNNPELTAKKEPATPGKQSGAISIPEEAVRSLINKWLTSWQSGNMETYRSCYASDFQAKGMNLDAWITNKNNVQEKSKNISISIEDVQISADENIATAVFIQHYSSSKSKDSGKKKLELKRINNEWKIYKEMMQP